MNIYCKCGCGREVTPGRTWIQGHNAFGNKNSLGYVPDKETRAKYGKANIGNKHGLGTTRTIEQRAGMSMSQKKRFERADEREKASESMKGNKNALGYVMTEKQRANISKSKIGNQNALGHINSSETISRMSKVHKEQWKDLNYAKMMMDARQIHPNGFEKSSMELLEKLFPGDWKFNGDFSQGILLDGCLPDVVNINLQKAVIELNGCYFHGCKVCNYNGVGGTVKRDKEKRAIYKKLGYKLLIIWEHELKDLEKVVKRIKRFVLVGN